MDEKSGMQAIERPEANKPMIQGKIEKYEHEYIRHGTQHLLASLDVITGRVHGKLLDSRGNTDFLNFIKKRVATNSKGKWIFIVDQLNTHKSAELVRWVAEQCNIQGDLGIKRKRGIVESMESRMKFLSNKSHRISFIYTPKHCSWLNQIEIWFSIFSRNLLKRLSCKSMDDFKNKITDYIYYFNNFLARPFRWTYEGKGTSVLKI